MAMSEQNEKSLVDKYPVNIREISQKQHIILRLEQIQRMVVKEPQRIHELDADRSLNHIRSEVKALQARLKTSAAKALLFEYKVLNEATDLLSNWEEEKELTDVLMADRHSREMLVLRNSDSLDYPALLELAEHVRDVRIKMFNKYKGYFSGLLKDNEDKRKLVDKQLKQTQTQAAEYLEIATQLEGVHGVVQGYHQQSMNALVGGFAIFLGMGLGGWWLWQWFGLIPGLFLGYMAFSNISHFHAYVTGKNIDTLYEFLTKRYEMKNVKPFFKYEDKKEPEKPSSFNATRGEALAKYIFKDLALYRQGLVTQDRRKDEFVNYLTYLDGRTNWVREQCDRMERLEKLRMGDKLPEQRMTRQLPPPPPLQMPQLEAPNLATHLGLRQATKSDPNSSQDPDPQAEGAIATPPEETSSRPLIVKSSARPDLPTALPEPPEDTFSAIPSPPPEVFAPIPPPKLAVELKPKFVPKPIKVLRKASGKVAAEPVESEPKTVEPAAETPPTQA
jgi:hypothetical protein